MSQPPAAPKIYHITHVGNLASVIADGCLISDATMIARGGPATTIGMSTIKARRLALPVSCHNGLMVGACVPFYFCFRSVMLYVIDCTNHPELAYRGGQEPIVHLEADLNETVDWANGAGVRWAFSLSNAGAAYVQFRAKLAELTQVNWTAVAATDWRDPAIKEAKQAEFLIGASLPWQLISRIVVRSMATKALVDQALANAGHCPRVEIKQDGYY